MASSRSRKAINTDNATTKPLSLVQQRARQFEALAISQVKSKECNWWLSDFKNVKENCECAPCESLKSNDEGDIDSQNNVEVLENVVDSQAENIVEECQEIEESDILTGDGDIMGGARNSISEDEIITNDNDDNFIVLNYPGDVKVVEAMNDSVHFKTAPNIHHGVTIIYPEDEEPQVSDEE